MTEILSFSIDDLVGREFEGFFQRDPKLVEESRKYRKLLKLTKPELISQYDEVHGSSDSQDTAIDRPYDFCIDALTFDPASGLFLARGKDLLGVSVLVGGVRGQEIKFTKTYVGPCNPDPLLDRFKTINYEGHISRNNLTINMHGTYLPKGNIRNYAGVWELHSAIDSVLVV